MKPRRLRADWHAAADEYEPGVGLLLVGFAILAPLALILL